jgi:hypothetical protein
MDFYFLINCSTSLYNGPTLISDSNIYNCRNAGKSLADAGKEHDFSECYFLYDCAKKVVDKSTPIV